MVEEREDAVAPALGHVVRHAADAVVVVREPRAHSSSTRSLIVSRSRTPWSIGVNAPMSIAIVPTEMRWLAMRTSSQPMARSHCARGGTSSFRSRSTAIAYPSFANIAAT